MGSLQLHPGIRADARGPKVRSELHDIVIGLASAAIVGVFVRIIEITQKRRGSAIALRSYSVNGIYASSYTDEMNGVQRAVRDQVHIEQQGLDLPFLPPRKAVR